MELSRLGIVPKLLDFIRINEDSDELEILGKGHCVGMAGITIVLKCSLWNFTKRCMDRQIGSQAGRKADVLRKDGEGRKNIFKKKKKEMIGRVGNKQRNHKNKTPCM